MITLDATTKTLEVVLAGAVAANELPVVVTFVDVTTTAYTPGSTDTITTGTTPVTAVAAPAASTQRQIKFLSVYNADTVAATVRINFNNNATLRRVVSVELAVGSALIYADGEGFRVITADGGIVGGIALPLAWTDVSKTGSSLADLATRSASDLSSGELPDARLSSNVALQTGGTVTADTPVYDATQTWNAGAVTFTGLKFNATDTASAAASLLLDLQVGSTSKFKVGKDGTITAAAGLTIAGALAGATSVSVTGGTVTADTPVYNATQTWNAGGVTFTGLKFNVTDTASAAASLLLDLQVGGASKFKVQKDGTITAAAGVVASTGTFTGSLVLGSIGVNANLNSALSMHFNIDTDNNETTRAFRWYTDGADASGTELMTLLESGRLGIGISPAYRIHAKTSEVNWVASVDNGHASNPLGMLITLSGATPNDTNERFFFCQDASALRMAGLGNGGLKNYSGNNVNLSDLGAKDIGGPAPSQRDKIRQIALYRGRYKDSKRGHDDIMWGAQDIQRINPEWVDVWQEEERDASGAIVKPRLLGTRDHLIFLATVGVVAEHDALIDDHETKIAALDARLSALGG